MRKEHTSRVEIRNGRVYVTRQLEGLKAPYTKWDFLSDSEREYYATIAFNSSCSVCGEPLKTEADFAQHYFLTDVQYFNLGYCSKRKKGLK
jgi:hypothetical protein